MTTPDIITAVPVAFGADGALDLDGSRAILRHVAASGNEGAFVLGTTGEFPAMSIEERNLVAKASVVELAPHMRVIVHVGAPSLHEVLQLIEGARAAGATEIAVITPYYLPATDNALREFFGAVSAASDGLDVYLYVFRNRTGNFVSAELMAELALLPNVKGAKVSEESLDVIAAYRAVVPEGFALYTGADRDLGRAAEFGAQGVISGVSSVFPKPFRELAAAVESGDKESIAEAQFKVDDVVATVKGDMTRMKAAYAMMGVPAGTVRMAVEAPSDEALADLRRAVDLYA
ncbi:dihydrodipicolinate synthase family protein [Glycomyces sp. NPDC047010]|uniref:dihydrodipicolinate synthase family protein n=1 Tax=Glycomyces sp. NPDC047010 TaxID=3155023 RepID=UPI003405F85B